MIVFELPRPPPGEGARMAALGSCRVHGPLAALAERGDLRYCAVRPIFFTHTAAEALQTVDLVAGGRPLDDALSPYVFGVKATPPLEPFRLAMQSRLRAVFVEVSHDRQFVYGDIRLQASYFSRHFIQPRRSALLTWFRALCADKVTEASVQGAVEALRRDGAAPDELALDILRRTRVERHGAEAIEATLKSLKSRIDGRLVVVGHIDVEGHAGAIMRDRRALNATLRGATAACGADFFDPSSLVAAHGSAVALDNRGADVYEYAPEFRHVVGEALIALALGRVRGGSESPTPIADTGASTVPASAQFAARSELAERLNFELVQLHRRRLADMGADDSGLFEHYVTRLRRGPLIDLRERAALELVHDYLPTYRAYGVMRAGLGELALLLAASGRGVIAYEPNPNRRAAIEAGREHLRAAGLIGEGSLTLAASLTPAAPVAGPALGVGLNIALTPGDPGAPREVEAMAGFDALLVDPEFFFRRPSDGGNKPPLDEILSAIGFARRRDYPADGLAWFHR